MVKSVSPSDRLVENSVEKVPIAVRLVASRSDESARAAEPEEATAFTESEAEETACEECTAEGEETEVTEPEA